jgi:negative regulator of sigma E activity
MKTPPEDIDLLRWLDDEMTPLERERFAARLSVEPALRREAESLQTLGRSLRDHLPREMAVPHPDFFNSQIQVRLARETTAPGRRGAGSWLAWFRLPRLAVAAALVLLTAVLVRPPIGSDSRVLGTYTPDPGVHASTHFSEAAEATVLLLEGLEEMPAERPLVGFRQGAADQQLFSVHQQNARSVPPQPAVAPKSALTARSE